MAQMIKQPNIFGRLGSGIGKGLGEQIPKEIERNRLASGLKNLGEQQGLDPYQQFAGLAGVAHEYPQIVQSGEKILNHRNQANAYAKGTVGNPRQKDISRNPEQDIRNVPFANIQQGNGQPDQKMSPVGNVENQQKTPNVNSKEDIPQVAPGNELNQKNLPRLPWTPQQRNQAISDYIKQGFLPEQAKQLQADDESRDLAEPGVYKDRLKDIESAKGKVRDSLKRHLETKLQKKDSDVFKDIEGKMLINAERGMIRDLIKNPNADVDNVANDWSDRLYDTAIAKGKMKNLGKTTGIESFFRGDTNQKKLKEYQDIFKRSGNLEEFKNILEGPNFGMSPQGAASQAYPPNEKINKYISKYKSTSMLQFNAPQKTQEARKAALEIENDMGPDDSPLAIVRKLSEKDPFFDQQGFLDQLSDDKEQIGLNERQRLELGEGVRDILPTWGDLLYLPIFRR